MADKQSREGKVIGGKRRCGKSTELIKQSHETGIRILTANKIMAKILMDQAKEMGLNIKPPLTPDNTFGDFENKEVLIDEVEIVLQKLLGKRVAGMSTSMPMKELETIGDTKGETKQGSISELKINLDVSDALKGLKAVQREVRNTTRALKALEQGEQPLLRIEVESLNGIPRVFYKGEEVKMNMNISYEWKTKNQELGSGEHRFRIEHGEFDGTGSPVIKEISEGRAF